MAAFTSKPFAADAFEFTYQIQTRRSIFAFFDTTFTFTLVDVYSTELTLKTPLTVTGKVTVAYIDTSSIMVTRVWITRVHVKFLAVSTFKANVANTLISTCKILTFTIEAREAGTLIHLKFARLAIETS